MAKENMSRLEELIEQYCPEGVEWKPLAECCNILDGKRKPITKGARQSGPYPYYGANGIQDWVADYIFDGTYVLIGEDGSVITPNGTPIVNWAHGKIWVNNHAHIIAETTGVLLRFLFYYIQIIDIHNLVHGNIPKLTQGDLKDLEIPVPPLPVQEEIVRILDTFTELQAELQAELQKRLQQYEYYKKQVFLNCSCPVQYSIDEICTKITDGSHFSPKSVENGYHMPSVKDMLSNGFDFTSCKQISEEDYKLLVKNGCQPKVNDILIAKDGSMLKYAFPVSEEMPIVVLSSIAILSVNTAIVKPAFLAYYFKQKSFKDAVIREYSTKGGVPRIVLKNFKRIKVSIPSLEEQQRIVSILDRFDTLTNDLTSGLPAEMEKRRQQYEFYRDKLLTFKRKEA